MGQDNGNHRRRDRYGYRYSEGNDTYLTRRVENTNYHSDVEQSRRRHDSRQDLSASQLPIRLNASVSSPADAVNTARRNREPSPPLTRRSKRSVSIGQAPESERSQPLDHLQNPSRAGGSRGVSPASDTSRYRDKWQRPADSDRVIPSINIVSPDDQIPDDRHTSRGRSWSRNPGSAVQRESSAGSLRSTSPATDSLGKRSYRYSELKRGEIRLVRILPAKMSAIKCAIEHYSLANVPEYVAVSYAWGDVGDTEQIYVDGMKHCISASLFGALSAFRQRENEVFIWADALCIDQQNMIEKSKQIKLMTSIYAKAKSVAIWLGPEADNSQSAIGFLKDLSDRSNSGQEIKSWIVSPELQQDLAAVGGLFSRSYWKRLWVVQEVYNASNITVYCGSSKIAWRALNEASDIFDRYESVIDAHFANISTDRRRYPTLPVSFKHVKALFYEGPRSLLDRRELRNQGEAVLLHVLRRCRSKLSEQPKDKVYGLLGVLPEPVRSQFPVDYNDSVKEVFTNVVDFLIYTTRSLDVICESIHFPQHSSSANLPSWVPDWSHNPATTSLSSSYVFSASGSTVADWKFTNHRLRNELEISAVYLDSVKSYGVSVGTQCTLADYMMAFLHWRAILVKTFGRIDQEKTSRKAHEAFCRTLNLDQKTLEGRGDEWMESCYHVFSSLIKDRLPYLAIDSELQSFVTADTGVERDERRQFLQDHFGKHMMGRSFCITNGKRMGMGSGSMLADDIIVVPFGCQTPVILRKETSSPTKYRLVGDIYIDKYMRGRAMDMHRDNILKEQKYVLV
ncbi:hypothetical protein PFICI_12021 [Pestalotiopsis fici W106-1]|uniref:Heterokaryon incompatibility domain-containing protein n=1 Tax=Pestalotiopsis fici (strain W106-1 / CGMCC3.15140) TaxID=1229662 RepID=W3WS33_PESFW|nr:uncharacterized protein PFICI_12021 [Pestalotiopsis fici W106-1]ETS76634.1 hypothetical protein PFICI_12021 [Pestalotiopsis fici W106-1]